MVHPNGVATLARGFGQPIVALISIDLQDAIKARQEGSAMMGQRQETQQKLFYQFSLKDHSPRIIFFGPLIGLSIWVASAATWRISTAKRVAFRSILNF